MAHIKTQTEWENDMSVKILQHARSEIYLDLRYLDVALSALKPQRQWLRTERVSFSQQDR